MSADVLVVRHLNGTRYTRPFAVGSLRIIEGVRAVPGLAQVPVPPQSHLPVGHRQAACLEGPGAPAPKPKPQQLPVDPVHVDGDLPGGHQSMAARTQRNQVVQACGPAPAPLQDVGELQESGMVAPGHGAPVVPPRQQCLLLADETVRALRPSWMCSPSRSSRCRHASPFSTLPSSSAVSAPNLSGTTTRPSVVTRTLTCAPGARNRLRG